MAGWGLSGGYSVETVALIDGSQGGTSQGDAAAAVRSEMVEATFTDGTAGVTKRVTDRYGAVLSRTQVLPASGSTLTTTMARDGFGNIVMYQAAPNGRF